MRKQAWIVSSETIMAINLSYTRSTHGYGTTPHVRFAQFKQWHIFFRDDLPTCLRALVDYPIVPSGNLT